MEIFDVALLSDDGLIDLDRFACGVRAEMGATSELMAIYHADALRELVRRGLIDVLEGSLGDIPNAKLRRSYALISGDHRLQ